MILCFFAFEPLLLGGLPTFFFFFAVRTTVLFSVGFFPDCPARYSFARSGNDFALLERVIISAACLLVEYFGIASFLLDMGGFFACIEDKYGGTFIPAFD